MAEKTKQKTELKLTIADGVVRWMITRAPLLLVSKLVWISNIVYLCLYYRHHVFFITLEGRAMGLQ